ncbi:telomere repeats-binding bouquet formation protein 1 isoform X2 [Sceloporus undulatus]|uniref:telomere repeats-binding bouquet formation protein 1 isoform X2 n=1 Tax=Sceloporus undulatus TaxID=8520 RepID=UPI001C4AFBB8|nr:telomere repeats-binding bouquet formation protein 1 isoform X2 [Sceloporus undulatus]
MFLLQLFRTVLPVSEGNLLDKNMNQYHLWSSVCSALCACVNNPQNEDNQKTCSLIFPHAKDWLESSIKSEVIRPICSFIGLTVANNSAIGVSLPNYNIVPSLLTLLSNNFLDSEEQFSIILTLGHCTESCEENQYTFIKNNGLAALIQALTESQDEELHKAATFVLQNCRKIMEKLSLQLNENSVTVDGDMGQLEVDMQSNERNLEDYWSEAKEILSRIKRFEKEHQEGKMKRQICDDIPQEVIPQTASKHLKANTSSGCFSKSMACTKAKQPLNSHQLNAAKFVNRSSKNELLKPTERHLTDTSFSQNEYSNSLLSSDKSRTDSISKIHMRTSVCEFGKSAVQARDFLFKQPDFVILNKTQQVQNTDPLCLSITSQRAGHTSVNPKIAELRCSGCQTIGLTLNSRNFSKILQTCQYLCEQHRIILGSEMEYKRKLKRFIISSRNTSLNYNENLQMKQDAYPKKQTSKQKYSFKAQDQNERHSFRDENTEIDLSDIPATAIKNVKRRTRKDFTSEEITYLLDGVKKMGHHWNAILWAYPFQKGRTNVDLAKKYCKLQKNEDKNMYDIDRPDISYK